jgi:pimeloyl-ACP methyl ester carboxylesterase
MSPVIQYARCGDLNIAYQVVGTGPHDIVLVPGWVSNIELFWDEPTVARFLERLASFSRLILFDKRGTGLSDRFSDAPNLEMRMDDLRAVLDAVGSTKATLFGYSEAGAMSMLFSATYPERVASLVMAGCFPYRRIDTDFPFGRTEEATEAQIRACEEGWGGPVGCDLRCPSKVGDERYRQWWARWLRMSASANVAIALTRLNYDIDVRHLLGNIHVPTLLLHSVNDRGTLVGASRYMAARIPGARLVEFPGSDHMPWLSDAEGMLDQIEEFVTGTKGAVEIDRILATVMFTDIVGSTEKAAALGDHAWRDLLQAHHAKVRAELARFRGKEIDTAGDGFLATFDGPARAIRCARAISDTVRSLGIQIRAGLHTGECEVMGDSIGGLAVHIGARIAGLAAAGEVMVSSTVKDLVAGSGLSFEDRGRKQLKGVPGEWATFVVTS